MHAVVVRVTIADRDPAESHLREQIVPGISQAPGFVAGHWGYKDGTGVSMIVFESEDAAAGMTERVESMLPDGVTLEEIDVYEVIAHA